MLAEMIKTSRLDIETLAMFVKANQVRPDWMSMQIPLGTWSSSASAKLVVRI
jgi:hypothetical protein